MGKRTSRDVAHVAGMIGHPARAAMLSALLGGEALPAGELARRAHVQPSTASEHLAQLRDARLITRRQAGRHVYYALANADVAAALEALALVASSPRAIARDDSPAMRALRGARTCYDHLAGRLGVLLTDTLLGRGCITARGYELTARGAQWLGDFGVDVHALRRGRRTLTRPCLDWTERRDHLAGAVGAAITTRLLEQRWLARIPDTRAVRLTLRGREGLYRTLGLELERYG